MANEQMWNFDVPTQMRQFAEQSVEQAKKAVDGFSNAAQKTATTIETQADTAQTGAKDVGQKVMGSPSRTSPTRSSSPRNWCAPRTSRR